MKQLFKIHLAALAFVAALAVPSALSAQQITADVVAPVAAAPAPVVASGPVVAQAGIVRAPLVVETTVGSLQNGTYTSNRNNVAWMGVGAAALIVGLLIGGDAGSVVAITGGVIGLVGLFRYLN